MVFKKLNKRGLLLNKVFISLAIAGVMILIAGQWLGDWSGIYDSGINYDLTEYSTLDNLTKEADLQRGKVTPEDDSLGTGDYEGKIMGGGFGLLGRIFKPFSMVFNMFQSLEKRFSLPTYIAETMLVILTFSLIYALVAIIFKIGRTSA